MLVVVCSIFFWIVIAMIIIQSADFTTVPRIEPVVSLSLHVLLTLPRGIEVLVVGVIIRIVMVRASLLVIPEIIFYEIKTVLF